MPTNNRRSLRAFVWKVLWALSHFVPRTPRMTVLFYHSISDSSDFFAVAPAEFDRQMQYLKKYFDVVPLARAFAHAGGERVIRDSVAVTLDDGYEDAAEHALPVLRRYGIPATVFVLPGSPDRKELGNDHPLLMLEDLIRIDDPLIDIGSHALSHKKLTKIPLPEAVFEMKESRRLIEESCGSVVEYLAYPKGSCNPAVMRGAKEAGYCGAVGVAERGVRAGDDIFALPRVQVDSTVTRALFGMKLSRAADWYYALWSFLKRER